MNSNDLNTVELLDDVDNLLFLCDRLHTRLNQVTSYVDEVKQMWINKRRSIEVDSNVSPLVAQKASKCNKVLLNVAEKLAIVELQTESLHNLQSSVTNLMASSMQQSDVSSSTAALHPGLSTRSSSVMQMNNFKQESVTSGFAPQRDLSSVMGRSSTDPRVGLAFQNLSQSATKPSSIPNRTREGPSLSNDLGPGRLLVEQTQSQQPSSAFHRPVVVQEYSMNTPQHKQSPLKVNDSPNAPSSTIPRPIQNGSAQNLQQPIINGMASRLMSASDPHSSGPSIVSNGKVRVKMQVIKAGTIWRHADIPITDHPSAFFVCNQDPRIAEQFNMMSMEMNAFYNKGNNVVTPLRNPSIGDFCVARFSEDSLWYRARVVLIHDESILIVFIDYGNSETKPANEIFALQETFTRLPAMAVACTLADSFPSNQNFWTTEETEIFNRLVKGRIVEIHFQQGSDHQWPLHFVKVMLDGQTITQHPQLAQYITPVRNEQIALHFNDKLTSMEYILYNVAVVESDIYNGSLP